MKAEYDLSKMKSRKNPYASKLKKSVTMRLSEDVIGYFNLKTSVSGEQSGLKSGRLGFSRSRKESPDG